MNSMMKILLLTVGLVFSGQAQASSNVDDFEGATTRPISDGYVRIDLGHKSREQTSSSHKPIFDERPVHRTGSCGFKTKAFCALSISFAILMGTVVFVVGECFGGWAPLGGNCTGNSTGGLPPFGGVPE